MARRPRVFARGLLYHVIVRGNQRRKTFRMDDDYKAYLDRLEKYRVLCHVRETNLPAQLFFRSLGFRAVSIVSDFYEDTREDAYLMQFRA